MLVALANGRVNVDWWSLICTVVMFRGGEQQLPSYYIGRKARANQNEKNNLHVNQNVHNSIVSISVQEDYNPGRENTAITEIERKTPTPSPPTPEREMGKREKGQEKKGEPSASLGLSSQNGEVLTID